MNHFSRITFCGIFLLSLFRAGHAQKFAWTNTVFNTDINFSIKAMNVVRQELCVGGNAAQLTWRDADPGLFDGNGNSVLTGGDLYDGGDFMFVFGFDGKLKWNKYFSNDQRESDRTFLKGFTYDNNNHLVALVHREMDDDNSSDDDDEDESGKGVDSAKNNSGYYLWYFDASGNVSNSLFIPHLNGVDVTDFKACNSGGFVLAGHADEGKIATNLTIDAGKGGCDFIVFIDQKGEVAWGDALSYQVGTCCSYGADPKIAMDETGNIYLAGSYEGGARFGGKIIKLAPVPYNPGKYYSAEEAYVAAYSPTGKFLWVNTAGTQSRFSGIAAAGGYVYIATQASKTGTLYNQSIDTTDHQHVFITVFDTRGKFKRNLSTGTGKDALLSTDTKGNLVVTGTIGIETGYLQRPDSVSKTKWRPENCFVAFYGPDGNFQKCFLLNLLKIPSDDPPACLAVSAEEFFLAGNLWGTLPISLHILDHGFPDIKLYGGGAFAGRWKQ